MNTGQYISGAGHLGLIAYALFGGLFLSADNRDPIATQEVALISEAQFAALTRDAAAPDVEEQAPELTAPTIDQAPQLRPTQDTPPEAAPPPSEPDSAAPDEAVETPAPLDPQVDVTEQPPAPSEPEISLEDPGAGLPDIPDQRPTPRPVPRIAPEAVTTPEPQPEIADAPTPDIAPDAEEAQVVEEDKPAAAPEEAATEIVTEAETPSGMSTSPVPKARPSAAARAAAARRAEAAKPAADPAPDSADAVAEAAAAAASALVAAAASETPASPAKPAGPPLTGGEKDALRVAVSQCWNVGALSSDAMRTTITVGLSMNKDGTPQSGSLKLLGHSGGSQAGADAAYEVARRAILRCGARGFNLPVEKFDHWRTIEMTFDPEQMRFK